MITPERRRRMLKVLQGARSAQIRELEDTERAIAGLRHIMETEGVSEEGPLDIGVASVVIVREGYRSLMAHAWREGYMAGWGDRHEDEDNPLPAGRQHDTPNPYEEV